MHLSAPFLDVLLLIISTCCEITRVVLELNSCFNHIIRFKKKKYPQHIIITQASRQLQRYLHLCLLAVVVVIDVVVDVVVDVVN